MALIDDVIRDFGIELGRLTTSVDTAGRAFSDQLGSAGKTALQLFATRFPMASAAVMEFAKVTGATVGAIVDLAKTAQDGAASVSSVTGALSSLPYGLGELAKAASFAAQVLEKNIATQENLAKSGANFSGNLDLIRQSAAKTYLGLDQFGAVVAKNADVFSTMAGNVQKGTNRFVAIQNELLAPGSSTANNLATLGYSFQDAANLTASYMRQQGTMNKQGLQDNQKIAASVAQYGRELDVLSKLTGQSREAIEQKLAAENQEAQFQAYLASLAPAEAEKLQQGIRAAMAQGGQGAVDALKAMAMGFPPMTEAAQVYTATQRAGVSALEQYNQNAKNAGITTEENAKKNARILAQQISQGAKDREQLQQVLRADALAGGNLSKSFADATKLQTKFKDMTEEQIAVELEKMNTEAAREKSQAQEGKNQQQAMMDLTNQILARVLPAFNFLLKITLKVADFFGKITSIFDVKEGGIYDTYIKPVIDKLFRGFSAFSVDGSKFEKAFTTFGEILTDIFKFVMNVVDVLVSRATFIYRIIGPGISFGFEVLLDIFNGIASFVSGLVKVVSGVSDVISGFFSILTGDFKPGVDRMALGFSNIWKGLEDAVMSFINFFKDIWASFKNLLSKAKDLPIIGSLFEGGQSKESESSVPKMAEGGIVTKATTALVGEGSEAEAILPLSKLKELLPTADVGKNILEQISSLISGPNLSTSDKSFEFLQSELQMLNKQSAEMIRYMRETAEYTKLTVDATNSLSGDLFKF